MSLTSSTHRYVLATVLASSFFFSSSANAQEPAPAAQSTAAPPASVQVAPNCTLGNHAGIEDADAATSADVICHDLAKKGSTGAHEVRMGKLGGRILVTVDTNGHEERVIVSSLEELPTAASRLGHAAADGKSFEDEQKVDEVVGMETRAPRVKTGQMGFKGGMIGAAPVGSESAGPAPGVALGLLYRADRWAWDGHLRAGGGGGSETTLTHLVLASGGQYYFSDGDIAPYLGAGMGLMSYSLKHDDPSKRDASNTGLGLYVEGGVEALRTHRTAIVASVRADVPLFALRETSTTSPTGQYVAGKSEYVVPISLMVGVLFH